ncbi:MAG TPA: putative lipopolysaccharide heptosyltransferase III [Casimicrobiaceae bacterium]|jgi:heptosyltransferase-3
MSSFSDYPPDAVALDGLRRVLVTKLRHHGDVLLASPVFTTLKRAAPGVEIDALVYVETAPMLENHPAIARIHSIDRGWKKAGLGAQWSAERKLLAALKSAHYDLVVHLTDHPRGLTLARALAPRYAVTRERRAGEREWLWRRYYTHFYKLPRATPRHAVETNLDALRRIGIEPEAADKALVLVPSIAARARADALLRQHGLAAGGFVHVHPGSRWLFKCWTAAQSATLLDRLAADGHAIVLTAAPDPRERALVDAMLSGVAAPTRARIVDLAGQLTLPELAALTAQARLFVGVDSAPMHIAAAMHTPVVALFGPSGEVEWGPWGVVAQVVASDRHPCRPCGQDGCGGGKVSECLTTLPVSRVHDAVRAILAVPR